MVRRRARPARRSSARDFAPDLVPALAKALDVAAVVGRPARWLHPPTDRTAGGGSLLDTGIQVGVPGWTSTGSRPLV